MRKPSTIRSLIPLILILLGLIAKPPAEADTLYNVSTVTIDEMAQGTLQPFSLYLRNLRENSTWTRYEDRIAFRSNKIGECGGENFALVPRHAISGDKVSDSLVFIRCGKRIGEFTLERTGENLAPVADDDLFSMTLPPPSASQTYRLRSSLYDLEIVSQKRSANERRSTYKFVLGSTRFQIQVLDLANQSGDLKRDRRSYRFDLYTPTSQIWGTFEQKRDQKTGHPASFEYVIKDAYGTWEYRSGAYRNIYFSNIEGNSILTVGSLLAEPGGLYPSSQK